MPPSSPGGTTYNTSLLPVAGVDDLVNADTGMISQLASDYSSIAEAAQQAAQTLRGQSGGVEWEGQAAVAFHENVGKVPSQLDTIHSSYASVANALNAYEPEVSSAQSAIYSILDQLESAHANLTTAQGNLASAKSTLNSAQSAQSNAPAHQSASAAKTQATAVSNANDNVTAMASAVSNANAEISSLVAQGQRIVDGFTQARSSAASAFSSAGHSAPQESFWDKVLGDVENIMKTAIVLGAEVMFGPIAGKFIGNLAWDVVKGVADTVKDAVNLPDAIYNFAKHPSLSNLEKVGTDFVAAATIVLLATGVGEGMLAGDAAVEGGEGALDAADAAAGAEGAGGADGAASLADRAGSTLHSVNEFADTNKYFKTGMKAVNAATTEGPQAAGLYKDAEKGKWGDFARDAVTDATSDVAGHYTESATDKLTGAGAADAQHEAAEAFATKMAEGKTANQALRGITKDQRTNLLKAAGISSGKLPGTTAGDRALLHSLNSNNLVKSSTNNVIKTTTRSTAAGLVTDPLKDQATDAASGKINGALHLPAAAK